MVVGWSPPQLITLYSENWTHKPTPAINLVSVPSILSVHSKLVICPTRYHTLTNPFISQERAFPHLDPLGRPKHRPVSHRHFPRSLGPLEIPLICRIVLAATPAYSMREAVADHGFEYNVCDTASALSTFQNGELVKIGDRWGAWRESGGNLPG